MEAGNAAAVEQLQQRVVKFKEAKILQVPAPPLSAVAGHGACIAIGAPLRPPPLWGATATASSVLPTVCPPRACVQLSVLRLLRSSRDNGHQLSLPFLVFSLPFSANHLSNTACAAGAVACGRAGEP